jgi:hypothetical protein
MGQIFDNNRIAQISSSRVFTTSLINLNSDLADILLSGKSDYFQEDLLKTKNALQQIEKESPEIADLNLQIELAKLLNLYKQDIPKEEKYAKLNGILKQNIITPIFKNREWLPVTAQDQAELQELYHSMPVKTPILSPQTLKLVEKKPEQYEAERLDMRRKPNIPSNWRTHKQDVEVGKEILKRYIKNAQGDLDEMIDILNDGEQKVRKVLQLSDMSKILVDYKGDQISLVDQIHRRVVQIAARMHDCGLLAIEVRNKLYRLEELPSKLIYSPFTQEQAGSPEGVEAKDVLFWKQFMGNQDKMQQRHQLMKKNEERLKQAFRKFIQVWGVVYSGDIKDLNLGYTPETQFQLTRYGQENNKYLQSADELYEAVDALYYELLFMGEELDDLFVDLDFEEKKVAASKAFIFSNKIRAKGLDYEEQKQILLNNLRRIVGNLMITYGKIAKWDEHRAIELLDAVQDGKKKRVFDRLLKTKKPVIGVDEFIAIVDKQILEIKESIQLLKNDDKKDGDKIFKLNQIFSKYRTIKIAGDDPFDYVYGDYAAKHTKTSDYIYENEKYAPILSNFDNKMTNIDNKFNEFNNNILTINAAQLDEIERFMEDIIKFDNFYENDFSPQFKEIANFVYKKYKSI